MTRRSRSYDPIGEVKDEPLLGVSAAVPQLVEYREQPKLVRLPGQVPGEHERLTAVVNQLTDELLKGVQANPSKLWVMRQFQRALETISGEDSEGKEHVGYELQRIMKILHIAKSDGLLTFYLSPTGQ
ncbi:DUF4844 domain-containing protein [Ideonella sp. YS5]|uniref:DUF4844 domain-containing protein n=1 Tax=Ideonella sp. YS5 TaxID=3453714 RepID=UPI003EEA804A